MTQEYDQNIAGALVGAISELEDPHMDARNPHFKNRYATLKSCLDTVRPALARHGLVLMQFVMPSANGGDRLVTRILHDSGGFMEDEGISLVGADNMQKLGSAISYIDRRWQSPSQCRFRSLPTTSRSISRTSVKT